MKTTCDYLSTFDKINSNGSVCISTFEQLWNLRGGKRLLLTGLGRWKTWRENGCLVGFQLWITLAWEGRWLGEVESPSVVGWLWPKLLCGNSPLFHHFRLPFVQPTVQKGVLRFNFCGKIIENWNIGFSHPITSSAKEAHICNLVTK